MNPVEVIVEGDAHTLARRAADVVQEYLGSTQDPVLGLATGASVLPLYGELIRRHHREGLSFRRVRSFLLDDYIGLGPEHPQCYGNLIEAEFVGHVDIDPENLYAPDCGATDPDLECDRYDRLVTRAGVGLQILGVGRNGHLAFNEPGSSFESRTRVVQLAAATRADNARYFDGPDQVPALAMTQGMATIRQAAHLLVLAAGPSKAEAVRAALQGPITSTVPASALRLHSRVTVLLDPSAARLAGLGG
ncbi:MAG: glucosamine-6-phosphate deaminase [Acidimicrobiia bacterium]|nr:glucosamine-6-phosphate deaminase [Acidimicrobiia bacterium]